MRGLVRVALLDDSGQTNAFACLTVQSSHDFFWTEFWQRTAVRLGNTVVQNLWYSLHFLAGCSSRAHTVAPALCESLIAATGSHTEALWLTNTYIFVVCVAAAAAPVFDERRYE